MIELDMILFIIIGFGFFTFGFIAGALWLWFSIFNDILEYIKRVKDAETDDSRY